MGSPSAIAPLSRAERPGKLAIPPISTQSPGSASQISPGSGASTPTSAHQLAMKHAANSPHSVPVASLATSAMSQSQLPKNSITSKEWVIPPRPKPGRKPATDTPPTKRKAQNRAAQRAFRERRAARVGELEEQIDEQRDEHEHIEQALRDRVKGLDVEVLDLRTRCSMLEDLLEKERRERVKTQSELDAMRRHWKGERASVSSRNNSLPGLHAALVHHHSPRSSIASNASSHRTSTAFPISQLISPPNPSDSDQSCTGAGCGSCDSTGPCACVDEVFADAGPSIDCGKCSLGQRCACLEAALSPTTNQESDLKRRPSSIAISAAAPEEKRHKPNPSENEIDFTAIFSKKKSSAVVVEPISEPLPRPIPMPPRDSCGFCQEGTYCMCAEAEAAAARSTLPPMGSQAQTPPASENDAVPPAVEFTSTGAVKLPRLSSLNRPPPTRTASKSGSCGPNGPGTCAQCLADPKSGLFCRSLAANFEKQAGNSKAGGGCCGGSAGSGCCKSKPSSSTIGPSVTLSCADAYKTISSHRNFEKAADDIGAWLPKLRAVPKPQEVGESNTSRPPIEVETASIMSVLKGFDVRFGREP
ncbi:hypothetical protein BJ170DRAFT_641380 [Xylariales sp. AK1849]|nr:hypothetical protein BJ170DRAFT_641380 [Xylariales sp. AK1849]